MEDTFETWKVSRKFDKQKAPNVHVNCIYGFDIKTPTGFRYFHKNQSTIPLGFEDGDGTVSLSDLKICDSFANQQNYSVRVFPLKGVLHEDTKSEELFLAIKKIIEF